MQNLTANEMQNWRRYDYLHDPVGGKYRNPFDRGVFANFGEFFAKALGGPFIDWDARYQMVRACYMHTDLHAIKHACICTLQRRLVFLCCALRLRETQR